MLLLDESSMDSITETEEVSDLKGKDVLETLSDLSIGLLERDALDFVLTPILNLKFDEPSFAEHFSFLFSAALQLLA